MDTVYAQHLEKSNEDLGATVCKALTGKGYDACYVANKEAAAEKIVAMIEPKSTVGIPGTVTARELALVEKLTAKECTIFHHWDPNLKDPAERKKRFLDEIASDWYIMSTNAITRDGVLLNVDGTGNRVAGMAWGPGKLLIVAGINKVCWDLEAAFARVRVNAAPPNARRVNAETPCTTVGVCMDCNAPKRICRATLILDRAPLNRKAHVVLIGEPLGY